MFRIFGPGGTVPSPARRLLGEANAARDRMHWEDAANAYRVYLIEQPDNVAIWIQSGHALKECGNFGEAERAYSRAIELQPRDADARLHMGHLYKITSRWNEAVLSYELSYFLDPSLIYARDEALELRTLLAESLVGKVLDAVRSDRSRTAATDELAAHKTALSAVAGEIAALRATVGQHAANTASGLATVNRTVSALEHDNGEHKASVSGLARDLASQRSMVGMVEQRLSAIAAQIEHVLGHVAIAKALGLQLTRLERRIEAQPGVHQREDMHPSEMFDRVRR